MSKSIRIRDYLYEEIQKRADEERRPLISQLELLLEQALAMERAAVQRTAESRLPGGLKLNSDDHFKPDFKK